MAAFGHWGLALATSLAAFVNAGLLLISLAREGTYRTQPGSTGLLAKALGASLVMGLLLYVGTGSLDEWLAQSGSARALRLGSWILAGTIVYAAALLATGIRPRHLLES